MKNRLRMYICMGAMVIALVMSLLAVSSVGTQAQEENLEGYMLKSWCGKVAVYMPNGTEPVETTGIELKNLPSADQNDLEKGIYISNDEELARILEDLGS